MLTVLRNPTYAKLFTAQVVALVGTGLLTVALGLLAFDLAGGAAGSVLGTALTVKMIAYVGVAPVIAAAVDRLPKKVVLVAADAVRLLIALSLPFVTEVWHIYLLVFILQSASATFTPAFQSLIPSVLPDPKEYTAALSLSRLAYDLESLLSPVAAAALLLVLSYDDLFVATAVGFAVSIVFVLAAKLPSLPPGGSGLGFWQRLPLGLRVFVRTPTLRFLALANVVVAAGTALVLVNTVVYTRSALGLDESSLAIALASFGAGSLVATLAVSRIVSRIGVVRTMSIGLVVVTAGLVVAVAVSVLAEVAGEGWFALLATWVLLGAAMSLVNTPSARLLADASTPADRNLVYTAQFALSHACFLVTYPLAGWIGATSLTVATVALLVLALAAGGTAILYAVRVRLRTASDLPQKSAPLLD
jgi:MFS family permease